MSNEVQTTADPVEPQRAEPERSGYWHLVFPVAAGIFVGLGVLAIVWLFARSFAVLVLSVTIADALSPFARTLQKYMPRTVAVALIYVALIGLLGLVGYFLAPMLVNEATQVIGRAPELISSLEQQAHRWFGIPAGALADVISSAQSWSDRLLSVPLTLGTALITAVIILFLSFYWLLAAPAIYGFLQSLFPENRRRQVAQLRDGVSRAMGGYFRGVVLNALATGSLAWIGLYIAGVNYSFALGVLTALGEFIPYLGPIVTAIPGIAIALLQSPTKALWALLVYVIVEQTEGHLLTPNIMRRETDVPQVLVIIALFAGGSVGGVLGAIVSVPLAGALKVIAEQAVAPAIRRWSGADHKNDDLN